MGEELKKKFFMGGLNYETTEETLKTYFSKWGNVTDCVVMRFPDSKRSRGFGFITYENEDEAQACLDAGIHSIDGSNVELKRPKPKGEQQPSKDRDESARKIFIGGLSYNTTDEGLKTYFQQFGEVVDCIVMKYKDTDKSRGFGFVTYSDVNMVDEVQKNRPHTIDGATVETKRATPREEGGTSKSVKKIFVGGFKDKLEDSDLEAFFSEFGTIASAKQVLEKGTGKKLGFGFIEFEDYDSVDRIIIKSNMFHINGVKVDVRKALDKSNMQGGGDFGGNKRGGNGGWGGNQGYGSGGGYGDNLDYQGWGQQSGWNQGGYGNQGSYGGQGGFNNDWQANSWSSQGSGWGGASNGTASYMTSGSSWGGGYGTGNGSGGAMRNNLSGNRNAPYPTGGRGGGGRGGGRGGAGPARQGRW